MLESAANDTRVCPWGTQALLFVKIYSRAQRVCAVKSVPGIQFPQTAAPGNPVIRERRIRAGLSWPLLLPTRQAGGPRGYLAGRGAGGCSMAALTQGAWWGCLGSAGAPLQTVQQAGP